MNAFDVLSGFIPLIIMGALTLGVIRLAQRAHGEGPVDAAALTRQAVLYGLLFITMILTASGIVWAYGALTTSTGSRDNAELAQALALLALGLPVFTALLAIADRRLRRDALERESIAWSAYLTAASAVSLIGAMVGAYQVVSSVIDDRPNTDFDDGGVVTVIAWGAFFATHWVFLRRRHQVPGDIHLGVTSLIGLVPMAIGQAGLLAILFERLYDGVLDRTVDQLRSESAPWAALFVVGCVVWTTIWLREFESARRSDVWYVLVLPIGALAGFTAALGAATRFVYDSLVWFVGETNGASAGDHFDNTPLLAGIGTTGLIAWLYHRSFVATDDNRTNIRRAYDYLVMAVSLVVGVVGALIIGASLLDDGSTDQNLAIAGITMLIVGGFTWSRIATLVVAHQTGVDGVAELRSVVRRSYLYATLGIGSIAVLIAGIGALQRLIEDGLDGVLSVDTIVDQRMQLVTVVIVGAVLWFHNLVLRSDQRRLAGVQPPPPEAHWPSRIIVLGTTTGNPLDVSKHPGSTVEYWNRTDDSEASRDSPLDITQLESVLAKQSAEDVLVVLDGETPIVIPFER